MKRKYRRRKPSPDDGYECSKGRSEDEKLDMRIEVLESKYIGLDGLLSKHIGAIAKLEGNAEEVRKHLREAVDFVGTSSRIIQRAEADMENHKRDQDKRDEARDVAFVKNVEENKRLITSVIPGIVEKIAPYGIIIALLTIWTVVISSMIGTEQRYVDGVKKDLKEYVVTSTNDMRTMINIISGKLDK